MNLQKGDFIVEKNEETIRAFYQSLNDNWLYRKLTELSLREQGLVFEVQEVFLGLVISTNRGIRKDFQEDQVIKINY